jgi:hypothetical protein
VTVGGVQGVQGKFPTDLPATREQIPSVQFGGSTQALHPLVMTLDKIRAKIKPAEDRA